MNYVYFDGKYFRDENSTYFKEFKVYLENVIFEKYPYIDNIRNLNKNEKTLSTLQTEETYTLHHKDGTIPTCTTCQGDKELICPDCDGTGVDEYGDDCDTCDFKSTGIAYIDCPKCSKRI